MSTRTDISLVVPSRTDPDDDVVDVDDVDEVTSSSALDVAKKKETFLSWCRLEPTWTTTSSTSRRRTDPDDNVVDVTSSSALDVVETRHFSRGVVRPDQYDDVVDVVVVVVGARRSWNGRRRGRHRCRR